MIDTTAILNSAIGSLAAGLLLVGSAPIWWRWWISHTGMLKRIVAWITLIGVPVGIVFGASWLLAYSESTRTPHLHPGLTVEEATRAISTCEMKSIETTTNIISQSSRHTARVRYKAACLIEKGFRWEE